MKEWAKGFYKGSAWIRSSRAFMRSKFGLCERCGGAAKIVHHKTYLTPENINNPDIALSWKNLEALCQDCHNKEHHGSKAAVIEEGLMFDSNGDMVAISPP